MTFPANPFRVKLPKEIQAEEEKPIPEWHTVAVGESWLDSDYVGRRQYLAAVTHGRRYGKKFSMKREGLAIRITRIA